VLHHLYGNLCVLVQTCVCRRTHSATSLQLAVQPGQRSYTQHDTSKGLRCTVVILTHSLLSHDTARMPPDEQTLLHTFAPHSSLLT
jgi:hypothetical protein